MSCSKGVFASQECHALAYPAPLPVTPAQISEETLNTNWFQSEYEARDKNRSIERTWWRTMTSACLEVLPKPFTV